MLKWFGEDAKVQPEEMFSALHNFRYASDMQPRSPTPSRCNSAARNPLAPHLSLTSHPPSLASRSLTLEKASRYNVELEEKEAKKKRMEEAAAKRAEEMANRPKGAAPSAGGPSEAPSAAGLKKFGGKAPGGPRPPGAGMGMGMAVDGELAAKLAGRKTAAAAAPQKTDLVDSVQKGMANGIRVRQVMLPLARPAAHAPSSTPHTPLSTLHSHTSHTSHLPTLPIPTSHTTTDVVRQEEGQTEERRGRRPREERRRLSRTEQREGEGGPAAPARPEGEDHRSARRREGTSATTKAAALSQPATQAVCRPAP